MNREKRFVNISVHKSNIKNGKGAYYAKVCNTGTVSRAALLQKLKERAPYMDVGLVGLAMEMLSEIVLEEVQNGARVEFFSLGSFSLSAKGAVEMEGGMEKTSSFCMKKAPSFHIKFEESKGAKRELKNTAVNVAIKKEHAPVIESIKSALPASQKGGDNIFTIKGEGLKILGERSEVGLYVEEQKSGKRLKIEPYNIIRNEPKTLTFILENHLFKNRAYNVCIATQYAKMGRGRATSILRFSKKEIQT